MIDYSGLSVTVLKLISRFGQDVIITRRIQGTYDTLTSSVPVTDTTITGSGIVDQYQNDEVTGTLIQLSDIKMFIAANGISGIIAGDMVTFGSIKYNVISVKQINPAGTPLLYECQLRL